MNRTRRYRDQLLELRFLTNNYKRLNSKALKINCQLNAILSLKV